MCQAPPLLLCPNQMAQAAAAAAVAVAAAVEARGRRQCVQADLQRVCQPPSSSDLGRVMAAGWLAAQQVAAARRAALVTLPPARRVLALVLVLALVQAVEPSGVPTPTPEGAQQHVAALSRRQAVPLRACSARGRARSLRAAAPTRCQRAGTAKTQTAQRLPAPPRPPPSPPLPTAAVLTSVGRRQWRALARQQPPLLPPATPRVTVAGLAPRL